MFIQLKNKETKTMAKKYIVKLSPEERQELNELVKKGKVAAYKRIHAQILLLSDIGEKGPGWIDEQISTSLEITIQTVENVRKRLVERGLEGAINKEKPATAKPTKLDGEQEAHLIALTCGEPPEGIARWNLRLLANKMVELNYVDSISHETIRQTLKKTKLSPGKKKNGVSHPKKMQNLSAPWKTR